MSHREKQSQAAGLMTPCPGVGLKPVHYGTIVESRPRVGPVQDAAKLALLDNPQFDVGANIVHLLRIGVVAALGSDDTQEMPA